ncbi:MAG TPA: DUF3134 family protein [Synechococcales cyanobacterium M55_K2018_004]|nr:DUF3134 family protein [Synechococcales cyanobacterium M55_K2018_004]
MSLNNRALRSQPLHQRAEVIPLSKDASILDWLEQSGRLLEAPAAESVFDEATPEELSDFIGDSDSYDYDDDDDDLDLED